GMLAKEKLASYKGWQTQDEQEEVELAAAPKQTKKKLNINLKNTPKAERVNENTFKWMDNINDLLDKLKKIESEKTISTPVPLSVNALTPSVPVCSSIQVESKAEAEESALQKLEIIQKQQALQLSTAAKEIESLQTQLATKEAETQEKMLRIAR